MVDAVVDTTQGTPNPPAAGAPTPPAAVPPVVPSAVAKPAAVVVAGTAPAEPKRAKLDGVSDDIPEDAEMLEMSRSAFSSRLARATTKELKKRFGTDDVDEILKEREELKTLRAEKETARQEKLTELEKANERAATAERERDEARTQAQQAHEHRVFERDDRHLTRLAEKTIDPDRVDKVLAAFARHISEKFDRKQLRKMNVRDLDGEATEFFAAHLTKHPKHGKDYEEKLRAQIADDLKKEAKEKLKGKAPVNNGAGGSRPSATDGNTEGKKLGEQPYSKIKEAGYSYR